MDIKCQKRGDLLIDAFLIGYDAVNRQIGLTYEERMALSKKSGEELCPPIFDEGLDKAVKEAGVSPDTTAELKRLLVRSLEETRKPLKYIDTQAIRDYYDEGPRIIFNDLVTCECSKRR